MIIILKENMTYISPVIAVLFMIFLAYAVSMFKPFTVFCYAFILQIILINVFLLWTGYTGRKEGNPRFATWGDFGIWHEVFSYSFWIVVVIAIFTSLCLAGYVYQIHKGKM